MGKHIDILLSSDNNYVMPLATVITSVIRTKNTDCSHTFYIIDDEISDYNKELINKLKNETTDIVFTKKPDMSSLCVNKDALDTGYISIATYYRLFSAKILPSHIHKILYLDCDMVVCSDLWDLYSKEFDDNYLLGVRDKFEEECCERLNLSCYVNAGMLLLNLDKWREDDLLLAFQAYSQKHAGMLKWQDQDILNGVCAGKIKVVEPKWNVQVGTDDAHEEENILGRTACVIHYISYKKPWKIGVLHPFFNEFQINLACSPFNYIEFKKSHRIINSLLRKSLVKEIIHGIFPDGSSRKKLLLKTDNAIIEYIMGTDYTPMRQS